MKAWILFLVLTALVVGDAASQQSEKTDVARIKGKWSVSKIEDDMFVRPFFRSVTTIEFGDDKVTLYDDKNPKLKMEFTFKLDQSKNPKEIDMIKETIGGKEGTGVMKALYLLEGDNLKICWNGAQTEMRPTQIGGKNDCPVFVLKRQKP